MEVLGDGLRLIVKAFRRECHRVLPSERTTVHGADAMLMVLQLAVSEVNKQRGGEFKASLSDVLMAWKHLLLDKLHLLPADAARLDDYDLIREAYQSFLKRSNTVDLLDVVCMYRRLRVAGRDPEEPVSQTQLLDFLSGVRPSQDSSVPSTPSRKDGPCSSQVKVAVRRVFYSYLTLLVNTKDDMALALALDVPSRGLGRQAFTDVKHAAQAGNTSLFLAVASFVRAIQLGGRGYAPAESDPLRKHVKGLSEFVQFLDNLEEILGETPDPSVCGARLVAAIRAALVKGRSGGDEVYVAAEETARELKETICRLHRIQKEAASNSTTGISPARPKAHAVNHATALGGRDTVKLLTALLDEEALSPPGPNMADVLSEEPPALGGAEGSCVLTLFRSPEVSTGSSPEPLRNRVQRRADLLRPKPRVKSVRSQFACTYRDEDEPPLSRVLDFPSTSQAPTCLHPAPKRRPDAQDAPTELADSDGGSEAPRGAVVLEQRSVNARESAGVRVKRKQTDSEQREGSENAPPEKKRPVGAAVKSKNGGKTASRKKLIAGQGKLTSFFRV